LIIFMVLCVKYYEHIMPAQFQRYPILFYITPGIYGSR
jgi:hypothetical protein